MHEEGGKRQTREHCYRLVPPRTPNPSRSPTDRAPHSFCSRSNSCFVSAPCRVDRVLRGVYMRFPASFSCMHRHTRPRQIPERGRTLVKGAQHPSIREIKKQYGKDHPPLMHGADFLKRPRALSWTLRSVDRAVRSRPDSRLCNQALSSHAGFSFESSSESSPQRRPCMPVVLACPCTTHVLAYPRIIPSGRCPHLPTTQPPLGLHPLCQRPQLVRLCVHRHIRPRRIPESGRTHMVGAQLLATMSRKLPAVDPRH